MFSFLRLSKCHRKLAIVVKKMSSWSFVQQLNPISNKLEWKVVRDDYDYNQEIATSCYGDMLHDDERNKKFGEALKKAIKKVHSVGKKAHVLDIGTGTGLLSMLAVKYGADSVTACEGFLPMANCALSILKENNFLDKIKIIKSHSTSLTVGENGDLKQKANILVSEVFDTELIGEGAIKTFNHAFENLLTEDCIVIPSLGTIYAQVVESDMAQKWNKLEDWKCGEQLLIKIPKEIKHCSGTGAVHDIQLSEFSQNHFKILSDAIPIFKFDWAKNKIPNYRHVKTVTQAIAAGKSQVVFMWWDLNMDEEGEIVLSCAPVWEYPGVKGKFSNEDIKNLTKVIPWRDHWIQGVYFLTEETLLTENEYFTLASYHDEFSFWFKVKKGSDNKLVVPRPVCDCAFHFLLSRTRIGAINDDKRRNCYHESLKKMVTKNTVCVVLSDISLLGFLSAKLGARKVYVLSESPSVFKVCRMLSEENNFMDVISVRSNMSQILESMVRDLPNESFDVLILSEPYFRNFILPWDNLAFWYMKEELGNGFENLKQINSIKTLPERCKLRGCAVQFDNLWKIATPLDTCEGFSMKVFDNLIEQAKEKAENYVEAHPLWEYPGIALSFPVTFFEFDFNKNIPQKKIQKSGKFKFECYGRCDGVVLWMEYILVDNCLLSCGPVNDVIVNKYITWDMFERQGVHLFRKHSNVTEDDWLCYDLEFNPEDAKLSFNFYFGSE